MFNPKPEESRLSLDLVILMSFSGVGLSFGFWLSISWQVVVVVLLALPSVSWVSFGEKCVDEECKEGFNDGEQDGSDMSF